jgi:hypothetical protein
MQCECEKTREIMLCIPERDSEVILANYASVGTAGVKGQSGVGRFRFKGTL